MDNLEWSSKMMNLIGHSTNSDTTTTKTKSKLNKTTTMPAPIYHFKILVPASAAGRIIGKGGTTIAQLQKDAGVRVKMSKASEFYPGTTERICLISGPLEGILKINDFFIENFNSTTTSIKILVPNSTAGMIIGKGGSYIKQIKEESGAYVQISQKCTDYSLPDRCVTIVGEIENIRKACAMILNKIVEDYSQTTSSSSLASTSTSTTSATFSSSFNNYNNNNYHHSTSSYLSTHQYYNSSNHYNNNHNYHHSNSATNLNYNYHHNQSHSPTFKCQQQQHSRTSSLTNSASAAALFTSSTSSSTSTSTSTSNHSSNSTHSLGSNSCGSGDMIMPLSNDANASLLPEDPDAVATPTAVALQAATASVLLELALELLS